MHSNEHHIAGEADHDYKCGHMWGFPKLHSVAVCQGAWSEHCSAWWLFGWLSPAEVAGYEGPIKESEIWDALK